MVAIETPSSASAQAPAPHVHWRLERVSFAAQEPPRTFEFQAGLNIVLTGAGQVEATVACLRSVLHGGDGTHVELSLVDGPSLVLFRPFGARHRLIELESGTEHPLAALDAFAIEGPSGDLASLHDEADVVRHLSRIDQTALWALADRVLVDRAGSGGAPTITVTTEAPAGDGADRSGGGGGLLGRLRRRPRPATELTNAQGESADQAWWQLAGPVDVDTALCHRARVEAAAGLQGRLGAIAAVGSADATAEQSVDPAEIVRAVCALVPRSRPLGGPHVVAVPSVIDKELLSFVLDYLAGLNGAVQVIAVTADEAVTDWARLESHARRTAVLTFDADTLLRTRRPTGWG